MAQLLLKSGLSVQLLARSTESTEAQNPTLSGTSTLLENSTLCSTEIDQNGTLAILAYAHCSGRGLTPDLCCSQSENNGVLPLA